MIRSNQYSSIYQNVWVSITILSRVRETQKFSFHPPTYWFRSIFLFSWISLRCLIVVFIPITWKWASTIKVWKIVGNNESNSLNLDRTINFVSFYFQRINLRDEIHSLTIQTRYLYAFFFKRNTWLAYDIHSLAINVLFFVFLFSRVYHRANSSNLS